MPNSAFNVANAINSGNLLSFQVLTTGTGATYTPSSNKVNAILVECVGGGGGSGGAKSGSGTSSAASGGGGGGYGRVWIPNIGSTYTATYTVGTGGSGGIANNGNGTAGGNTTFATYTANGGAGGLGGTTSASAGLNAASVAGGSVSGFDLNIPGQSSNAGLICISTGAAQAGESGRSVYGFNGYAGFAVNLDSQLASNSGYGAGAGGSASNNVVSGGAPGSTGSNGIIIVWEFS